MAAVVPTIGIQQLDHALRFYAGISAFSVNWVHRRGDMGPATMAELEWDGCSFVLVDAGCEDIQHAAGHQAIQIVSRRCEELARSLTTAHLASRQSRPNIAWTDALVAIVHDPFGVEWHLFDEEAWMLETGGPRSRPTMIIEKQGVVAL